MSFFSSLTLFYPGKPPKITGEKWDRFASVLRAEIGIDQSSAGSLYLKWGNGIGQDDKDTDEIDWDDSSTIGAPRDFHWDIMVDNRPWDTLWPSAAANETNVYRSHLSLGSLTQDACSALGASDSSSEGSSIAPDRASLSANPVCPSTLGADRVVCTGLVDVSFAGPGYFSWGRPFEDFASQYHTAAPVRAARAICRDFFPTSRSDRFDRIADHLGPIFLNRDYFEEGDWILSVVETG